MEKKLTNNETIGNIKNVVHIDNSVLKLILKIVFIIIFVFIVTKFFYSFYKVSGNYMTPNIKNGDLAIICKYDKDYEVGDVVVFEKDGKEYILRVLAKPGDKVKYDESGNVYVNGGIYEEDYVYLMTNSDDSQEQISDEIAVKENQYFLLGDNRASAIDSRDFGTINLTDIKGKIIFVLRNRNL